MKTKNTLSIIFLLLANVSFAQQGYFDPSFDTDGIATFSSATYDYLVEDVAIQADGKIVSCGFADDGTNTFMLVTRHLSNGSIDNSFGTNGIYIVPPPPVGDTRIDGEARAIEIQADGKIVIAGQYLNQTQSEYWSCVVRILSTGTIDVSFTADGHSFLVSPNNYNDYISDLTIQPDGKYLLAGSRRLNATYDGPALLYRMNANGTLDASFGVKTFTRPGTTSNSFVSIEMDVNNNIIVGGDSDIPSTMGNWAMFHRYDILGNVDNTFGTNGILFADSNFSVGAIQKILPLGDGSYFFVGNYAVLGKITSAGAFDIGFGPYNTGFGVFDNGASVNIHDAILLDNDEVAIAGSAFLPTGYAGLFAKFKSNGEVDSAFGQSTAYTLVPDSFRGTVLRGLALQSNGKIVGVGDYITLFGSDSISGIISRLNMQSATGLSSKFKSNLINAYPNPCTTTLNLKCDKSMNEIAIYDLLGGLVMKKSIEPNKLFEIEIDNLIPGSYILNLMDSEGQRYSKLIEKR